MRTTFILVLTLCVTAFAQTFCDGWEAGYAAGKQSQNDKIYITPICPIAKIGQDTYDQGYSLGFEKATGNASIVVPKEEENSKDFFCDGWKKGFESAMAENGKSIFIVPICPIPKFNERNFDDGFVKGYQRGLDEAGATKKSDPVVRNEEGETFCDGWQRGYQFGLQEWATENDKNKPNKITPICPNPQLNADSYYHGFERGKAKAMEDMKNH